MSRPVDNRRPHILRSRLPSWAIPSIQTRRQPSLIPPPTQERMGAAPSQPLRSLEQGSSSLSRTTPSGEPFPSSTPPKNGERKGDAPEEKKKEAEISADEKVEAKKEAKGDEVDDEKNAEEKKEAEISADEKVEAKKEAKGDEVDDVKNAEEKKKEAEISADEKVEAKKEAKGDEVDDEKNAEESHLPREGYEKKAGMSDGDERKEGDEAEQKKRKDDDDGDEKEKTAGSPFLKKKTTKEEDKQADNDDAQKKKKPITDSLERTAKDKERSKVKIIRASISDNRESNDLPKDIREGIAKLVKNLAVKHSKQGDKEDGVQGITMITLAGENRGATMNVNGSHLSGKEEGEASKKKPSGFTASGVNSNVQAINNSILSGSWCRVDYPGVDLVAPNDDEDDHDHDHDKRKEEPQARRRCLRALLMDSSEEDKENPRRRHGYRCVCSEGKKRPS